jgi:hypothetical protein
VRRDTEARSRRGRGGFTDGFCGASTVTGSSADGALWAHDDS